MMEIKGCDISYNDLEDSKLISTRIKSLRFMHRNGYLYDVTIDKYDEVMGSRLNDSEEEE